MPACMRSLSGFTQRLDLIVRDPGLPCLIDGLICSLAFLLIIKAIGPAPWWSALIGLPPGILVWRRRLRQARQRGPDRLILTADGRWQMPCGSAPPASAELAAGWQAGPFCGLFLRSGQGRRRRFYVSAGEISPESWRRLRVRLRLPQPPAMT